MSSATVEGERYSYAIDPKGQTTANKVLNLVGRDKRVLELGCGPGMMTRYMRERLDCGVTAIEFDSELAESARPFCEQLLIADLETLNFEEHFGNQQFDVVVAADVLEHLRDPWGCLRKVRPLLASDGHLVVSIPNTAHNTIIAQLLAGRFPYQEQGLLDRTHLRFFTRRDIEDLLLTTGYLPDSWDFTITTEIDSEFNALWLSLPVKLREVLAEARDGQVYQYIVRAYPSSDASWTSKMQTRLDKSQRQINELSVMLNHTGEQLSEYQKAFHEARDIIADRDQALAEYTKAFHDARDQLDARVEELDKVNRAFNEAREIVARLDDEKRCLEDEKQQLKVQWERTLGRRFRRLPMKLRRVFNART